MTVFGSIADFLSRAVDAFSDFSLVVWALMTVFNVCLLREIIFDMLICSLDGKCNSCSKRAKAIRKEQSLISRFTMLYIGEHLRSEYRTPYKIYMTLNALYMIWIAGNVIWVIAFWLGIYTNEALLRSVLGFVAFVVLIFLLFNFDTSHNSRILARRFPHRSK